MAQTGENKLMDPVSLWICADCGACGGAAMEESGVYGGAVGLNLLNPGGH